MRIKDNFKISASGICLRVARFPMITNSTYLVQHALFFKQNNLFQIGLTFVK